MFNFSQLKANIVGLITAAANLAETVTKHVESANKQLVALLPAAEEVGAVVGLVNPPAGAAIEGALGAVKVAEKGIELATDAIDTVQQVASNASSAGISSALSAALADPSTQSVLSSISSGLSSVLANNMAISSALSSSDSAISSGLGTVTSALSTVKESLDNVDTGVTAVKAIGESAELITGSSDATKLDDSLNVVQSTLSNVDAGVSIIGDLSKAVGGFGTEVEQLVGGDTNKEKQDIESQMQLQ